MAFFKATAAGELLGFAFEWFPRLGLTFLSGTVVERDYCHDMANFTRTAAEIVQTDGDANPYCFAELSSFLASTMFVTGAITAGSIQLPQILYHIHNSPPPSFYERQAGLSAFAGVTDECLHLVIQAGYIVLFAPAFPLAALINWLLLLFKTRADAYRYAKLTRRPMPRRIHELFGVQPMLSTISIGGIVTNAGLLFFTATQFTASRLTSLVATLPWLPASILDGMRTNPQASHFALFVAVEHLLLAVYVTVGACALDDSPQIARLRSWSERFEWQWLSYVRSGRGVQMEGGHSRKPFHKLGPFKLEEVPQRAWSTSGAEASGNGAHGTSNGGSGGGGSGGGTVVNPINFRQNEMGWSIDPEREWLLPLVLRKPIRKAREARLAAFEPTPGHASKAHATFEAVRSYWAQAKPGDAAAANTQSSEGPQTSSSGPAAEVAVAMAEASEAYGRISPKHALTLHPVTRKALGIPPTARRFSFAYPLTAFAERSVGELPLDLELELHDIVSMEESTLTDQLTRAEADERARLHVLRLLAVGGFIYYNSANEVSGSCPSPPMTSSATTPCTGGSWPVVPLSSCLVSPSLASPRLSPCILPSPLFPSPPFCPARP